MDYYPWYGDENFNEIIALKKEFNDNDISKKSSRCLENYQYMASNYINPNTPYRSLLVYYKTGVGKTLTAISIARNFIEANDNAKIVVLTKNEDVAENFKRSMTMCTDDYTEEEHKILMYKGNDLEKRHAQTQLRKIFNKRINENYTFYHFGEFKGKVKGKLIVESLDKSRKAAELKHLHNAVIIVDEVHNMVGNEGYSVLMDILSNSRNVRLVLMSATPVVDNIEDIFEISNLLNFNEPENELPVRGQLRGTGYLMGNPEFESTMFKDSEIQGLTQQGHAVLRETLKGKVLYLKTDSSKFPRYVEKGQHIKFQGYTTNLKVVLCPMHEFQERYYRPYAEKNGKKNFFTDVEYASSIVYPNEKIGEEGFNYIYRDRRFLEEQYIYQFSTKVYHLLQNIKKSPGKIFIYSEPIKNDGVGLIEACLKRNGYLHYKPDESKFSETPNRFIVISGDIDSSRRQKLLAVFNSKENIHGDIIKIVIGSKVLSEALTLKEVRQVHIYEPDWNLSRIDQVTGRAIRHGSHARLPVRERNVEIYKYCAVTSNLMESVDVAKYIKAERKDIYIKELERMMAQSSFGCLLNKARNIDTSYGDYSRECDYQRCNYTCDWEPLGPRNIDKNTYDTRLNNIETFKAIHKQLLKFFKNNQAYSFDDLYNLLSQKLKDPIDEIELEHVLWHILESGERISKNKILVNKGDFFIPTAIKPEYVLDDVYLDDLLESPRSSRAPSVKSQRSSKSPARAPSVRPASVNSVKPRTSSTSSAKSRGTSKSPVKPQMSPVRLQPKTPSPPPGPSRSRQSSKSPVKSRLPSMASVRLRPKTPSPGPSRKSSKPKSPTRMKSKTPLKFKTFLIPKMEIPPFKPKPNQTSGHVNKSKLVIPPELRIPLFRHKPKSKN